MLLQLISDILDLSKIEAGTMEFIDTDFELNKVMRELESLLCLKLSPERMSPSPLSPDCPNATFIPSVTACLNSSSIW